MLMRCKGMSPGNSTEGLQIAQIPVQVACSQVPLQGRERVKYAAFVALAILFTVFTLGYARKQCERQLKSQQSAAERRKETINKALRGESKGPFIPSRKPKKRSHEPQGRSEEVEMVKV
eukprot:gnl/TRDRNA2_/TRDRNA2_61685_c0_seq1.p1 gnl/TRDRNA2_/TRDRNA2_61685_c0~~gnl/TRDRNA2_/TRDRNA2_61685_c0_seq1.p1  ORF type:complete len:119 (+),score=16.63 gnl/TRDRNA2_/TRDRNA2_61685_c0_seq1:405-761(+)